MVDDPRIRKYLNPVRVSWPPPAPRPPAGAERLCKESIGQSTVWREPLCTLSLGRENVPDAPMLMCDFGREIHGGLQLVIKNTTENRPVRVRVTFGESISEALGDPDQDHAIHQHDIKVPWAGIHEVGCTGFRFACIQVVESNHFVELLGVRAVLLMQPEQPIGRFESSDPLLNSIWNTSAYTLQLCMQEQLWDGIKRDRLVWAGDLHPEVMTLLTTFGAHRIVPSSFEFLRQDTPLPRWMNGAPTYSLWWIISLRDWWMYTADRKTVEQCKPYLFKLLANFIALVDPAGKEHMPSRFLDWATANDPVAVEVGAHALMRLGMKAGFDLCMLLGSAGLAGKCRKAFDRLARYKPPVVKNQQANALRVLAGLAPAEETNQSIFAPDPMAGLSPFYAYYVLEARALAGDHSGCLDLIRKYWGGMLDMGATAFWEHFDLAWVSGEQKPTRIDEWPIPDRACIHRDFGDHCYKGFRHSLCHAWASGPAPWMTRHILGIIPTAPGFRKVRVEPNLSGLKWVQGTVPTPHGAIEVTHEQNKGGKIKTILKLPSGVKRDRK